MAELGNITATVEHVLNAEGIVLPSKLEAEREAAEIALTWASTFAVTFGTLAKPALDAGSLATEKAILVSAAIAGATAAVRACKPLILKAFRGMKKQPAAAPASVVQNIAAAPEVAQAVAGLVDASGSA